MRFLPRTRSRRYLASFASLFVKALLLVAGAQTPDAGSSQQPVPTRWEAADVEHIYGLMEARPHAKGALALTADALVFNGKNAHVLIPRARILALSTGHDRVEMFGTTGRILRMVIPDGGGLAAAAVMHHRVDMLTVQYEDSRSGEHAAVFYLPTIEAERALVAFGQAAPPNQPRASCQGMSPEPGSVLVTTSGWQDSRVPAAYRALVYEHVIERLRKMQSVRYVYREGEAGSGAACAQHVITLTLEGFRPGNQVKRAALGPVGMFVGSTQMSVSARITDEAGTLNSVEEIRSSVRTEAESIGVADKIAKTLAKRFAVAVAHPKGDAPRPLAPVPSSAVSALRGVQSGYDVI